MNVVLKIILLPISQLFNLVTSLKNYLYKINFFKSTKFDLPIICIGNLSAGGTGKTPHTDYLINLIKTDYHVGVLSRGYNRKTNGYIEIETNSKAENVGDEPLFYKWKHPEAKIVVCEDRVFGITTMAHHEEENYVYLLDDAFQHRSIRAGLNIILTEFDKLYTDDQLLPLGRLRENSSNASRADIIIVTKCPSNLSTKEKNEIKIKLKPETYQLVFFSTMVYQDIYSIFDHTQIENEATTTTLLVSGIANPAPIETELSSRFKKVYTRTFADHHNFSATDIESIIRTFKSIEDKNKILITTEKDVTRLFQYKQMFIDANINIFCLPIKVKFDKDEKESFDKAIKHYLSITLPLLIEEENIIEL